jgi:hypothetical protein
VGLYSGHSCTLWVCWALATLGGVVLRESMHGAVLIGAPTTFTSTHSLPVHLHEEPNQGPILSADEPKPKRVRIDVR